MGKLPKGIRKLRGGYQARLQHRGKLYQKFLSTTGYSDSEVLEELSLWLVEVKQDLSKGVLRFTEATKSNKTTGVLGVSRNVETEKRYVRYSVHWRDYCGKTKSTTFNIGREDQTTTADEEAALEIATEFRREWEYWADRNELEAFDHKQHKYTHWKQYT